MRKALIDTTILVDALLKHRELADRAVGVVKSYDSHLPVYAIKELKAGPLHTFVWLYNNLALNNSIPVAIRAIQSMRMKPNWMSTAQEALSYAMEAGNKTLNNYVSGKANLVSKYGDTAKADNVHVDATKIYLKKKIKQAWKKRRSLTNRVGFELPCFPETDYTEDSLGVIQDLPLGCTSGQECCLYKQMKADVVKVQKLETSISASPKPENKKRCAALKEVLKEHRTTNFPTKHCRNVGDAAFSFYCNDDEVILTTNIVDHEPLAKAVSRQVRHPYPKTASILYNQFSLAA